MLTDRLLLNFVSKFHKFLVTIGFMALMAIGSGMSMGKPKSSEFNFNDLAVYPQWVDACEENDWIDRLLDLPIEKSYDFCDPLDKNKSENSISLK